MNSLYRQILNKAWLITKRFRYLWIFGIFAAFLGNGGEYQVLFNQVGKVSSQPETLADWSSNLNSWLPKLDLSLNNLAPLIIYLIFGLAIIALFIWLATVSVGGLISGVAAVNNDAKVSFKNLFQEGMGKFWSLLGLNIIAKAIVYGSLIFILTPLMLATFAQGSSRLNLLIILLTFLIFLPLTIIVSLTTKYASAQVMLAKEKFWPAFKNGWRLFSANWLVSLEMALIVFLINLAVGLLFIVIALLIFSPFFFFGVIYTVQNPYLFNVLMYVSLTLLLLCSLVLGAILATFQITAWTLLYLRINTGLKAYSKLVRWVASWPGKLKKKEIVS